MRTDRLYDVIINPQAGGGAGKKLWLDLVEPCLKKHRINYVAHLIEKKVDNKKVISKLTSAGSTNLIVLGGDGTINEILNGIEDFENTSIGFIPAGSGNDFCAGMGIDNDPVRALRDILDSSETVAVDLGRVYYGNESRIFGISSGLGIDAGVCRLVSTSKLKKLLNLVRLGSATYGILTLKLLFTHPMTRVKMIYGASGEVFKEDLSRTYFMMAMNLKYEGGHVPMAPGAAGSDRALTAVWIDGLRRTGVLTSFLKLLKSRHDSIKNYTMKRVDSLDITSEIPLDLHADGEVLGKHSHVRMECLPGVLNVMMKGNGHE